MGPVIVTGGAAGIGFATAMKFSFAGVPVTLADIKEREVIEAAARLPGPSLGLGCDVADEHSVSQVVATTIDRFGSLATVVNNAGVMSFKALPELTEDDWLKVLRVDLLGAFYFIRESFKSMKRGGSIINVSSIHAIETTPMVAPYAAAKAALVSLTNSAAIEGRAKGIRVCAVLPGAIDTPMLWENPNIKSGLETVGKGDVGKPEDVAEAIYFLSTEHAAFIRGSALVVDGGRVGRL